jgi:hypothetical protein
VVKDLGGTGRERGRESPIHPILQQVQTAHHTGAEHACNNSCWLHELDAKLGGEKELGSLDAALRRIGL